MAERVLVVAADSVVITDSISFLFMIHSGLPGSMRGLTNTFGHLYLRDKGPNEINISRFIRREPNPIGPDGFGRWECNLSSGGRFVFGMNTEEDKQEEKGLQSLLCEMPDCTVLIEKSILDQVQKACTAAQVELILHEYSGTLTTS
jgi:hypothetical protein